MQIEMFLLLEDTDLLQFWLKWKWTDRQLLAEFRGDIESMSEENHSIEMYVF